MRSRPTITQKRLAGPQGNRADLHEQLVEQTLIMELAHQLPASNDPDVLAGSRHDPGLVDWEARRG